MGDDIKDANDLLKSWLNEGLEHERQLERVQEMLAAAAPMVIVMAQWAGGKKGAERDRAVERTFQVIQAMPKPALAMYRDKLAKALGIGLREFGGILKAVQGGAAEDDQPGEIAEVLGGWWPEANQDKDGKGIPRGWLVEYLYDDTQQVATFAYKDPEGRIDTARFLDINGIRYVPKMPNALIRNQGVLFPSKIGEKKSTRELVAIVEAFINRHYLLDDKFFSRLAAYYVLLTWLHDCFNAIPYLRAMGDYGSGKSQLMTRIGHVCYRMMATGGAGSSASLFRALEEYKGTAFMDEMDLADGGDMANDLIKILNLGAMKGNPIWRLDSIVNPDGTKSYEVAAYNIFGPKLIAMRKDFRDQAVASRCLTIKLMGKEPIELKAKGIKLHLDNEFYSQALAIRNLLLRWRLERWQPEIEVGEDLMDLQVPARLNQVTMPVKAIAMDDPALMEDITRFVRALNDELIMERSMGTDARVLDALVEINEKEIYKAYVNEGEFSGLGRVRYSYTKYIAKVANQLMDEMNLVEGEEGEEDSGGKDDKGTGKKRGGITSQTVGRIARGSLQLRSHRLNNGYVVILDSDRLEILKMKFGLGKIDKAPSPFRTVTPPEATPEPPEEPPFQDELPWGNSEEVNT